MKTIKHGDLDKIIIDQGSPPDDENQSMHYLSAMSGITKSQINAFGMTWDDTNIYLHDNWSIDGIRAWTAFVDAAYENAVPNENNICTWGPVLFELTGDDDVDYNGSYIDIVVDAIEQYLKC